MNGGPFVVLNGTLTSNAGCGSVGTCLVYLLPSTVTPVGAGDVAIVVAGVESPSDVVRFTNANGDLTGLVADRLVYFSDFESIIFGVQAVVETDLADTGFPSNFSLTNSSIVNETGSEGVNGFTFGSPNVYNGISDTPEPGTLLLMAVGAGVLAPARRRRAA